MNSVIEKIRVLGRPIIYFARYVRRMILAWIYPSRITDPMQIPIIINNRNRLEYLTQLIGALEKRGYTNIYIIDNASEYPPLIDYYKTCRYTVFRLTENVGHLALWKTDIHKRFIRDFYVYSDSDVVPVEECPADFMEVFWEAMKMDSTVQKVGFSLRIDDLPDHYEHKERVVKWESQWYARKVKGGFYEALIDTTFALYRPWMKAGLGGHMYRSAYPYQARHMPWYINSKNPPEEERYYVAHAKTSTHWTIYGKHYKHVNE